MKTIEYVNEYLLDCETGISDMLARINGKMEDVKILDVLGTVEIDGRINMGLEVSTDSLPFGEIIHVSFLDVWEYVYKDEMIDIQDKLAQVIGERLEGVKENENIN